LGVKNEQDRLEGKTLTSMSERGSYYGSFLGLSGQRGKRYPKSPVWGHLNEFVTLQKGSCPPGAEEREEGPGGGKPMRRGRQFKNQTRLRKSGGSSRRKKQFETRKSVQDLQPPGRKECSDQKRSKNSSKKYTTTCMEKGETVRRKQLK